MERHRFDFSFSGLKTAVSRWVQAREAAGEPVPVADVAASFQEAVTDVLTRKAVLACRENGVDHLQIGGGVAANSRLRAMAQERCDAAGIRLRVPRPGLCTDNGAMVAALGAQMVLKGRAPSDLALPADSSMPPSSRPDPTPSPTWPADGPEVGPESLWVVSSGEQAHPLLEGQHPLHRRVDLGGERRGRRPPSPSGPRASPAPTEASP